MTSMAAPQAFGKKSDDVIFGASAAAQAAVKEYGAAAVTNATIGAILDEEETLVCLPTVERVYRDLSMQDIIAYAPISGLPAFLERVCDCCFGAYRPQAQLAAVATAGGTGVIHHVIHNYTEPGDAVLTGDWFWGAYRTLCEDNQRRLATFTLFTDELTFHHADFARAVHALADAQRQVTVVLNTPAHNPTGYSLTDDDWDRVLAVLTEVAADPAKRVTLVVDAAYLDFAGEGDEARQFFRHFSNLPERLLVVVAYSMSKGFTMYGQRTGAMIGISSSADVIQEFRDINQFTSRATWSNISRAPMQLLVNISEDADLLASFRREQAQYFAMIRERAALFMEEAAAVGLRVLPYRAGFFISVPTPHAKAVCERLHADRIFLVPLQAGVRIAVCAVPKEKIRGIAGKLAAALAEVEQ